MCTFIKKGICPSIFKMHFSYFYRWMQLWCGSANGTCTCNTSKKCSLHTCRECLKIGWSLVLIYENWCHFEVHENCLSRLPNSFFVRLFIFNMLNEQHILSVFIFERCKEYCGGKSRYRNSQNTSMFVKYQLYLNWAQLHQHAWVVPVITVTREWKERLDHQLNQRFIYHDIH